MPDQEQEDVESAGAERDGGAVQAQQPAFWFQKELAETDEARGQIAKHHEEDDRLSGSPQATRPCMQ